MESWLPTSPLTQLTLGEHCSVQEAVSAFKILLKNSRLGANAEMGEREVSREPGVEALEGMHTQASLALGIGPKGSHHFVTRVELQAFQGVCLEEGVWL